MRHIHVLFYFLAFFFQVKVEKVNFDGLSRTKKDLITKHIEPVFAAANFDEVGQPLSGNLYMLYTYIPNQNACGGKGSCVGCSLVVNVSGRLAVDNDLLPLYMC